MNGITDASATKRSVIKIEPGIYDLGTTMLTQDVTFRFQGGYSQVRIGASNGIGIWAQGPTTVEGSQIAARYRTS